MEGHTMKKLLIVLLAVALAVSVMPITVFAEEPVSSLPSMVEYDGKNHCNLDTVFREEDEFVSEMGMGFSYLGERDFVIEAEYQELTLAGWVAFDKEIKAFGYRIDGGSVIILEDAYRDPEDAVVEAASYVGCDYAARFVIRANVAELKGRHTIDYVVRLTGNEDYIIAMSGSDMTVTYVGPKDPAETPTPEPVISETDVVAPGIFFTFDEEDKYAGFFSGGKEVEDIGWDPEKKCELLVVSTSQDPYISANVAIAAFDEFDEDIDCSKYKAVSIGVRVDENHGIGGQIYFATDENPEVGEGQVTTISYKNTTDFQAVTVNFAKIRKWSGILTTFRYDVFGTLAAEESTVEVYYVAFFETKADADNFAKAFAEKGYDAFPVIATPTPKPTNTPTPTPTSTPEGYVAPTDVPETGEPTETEVPGGDDKPADSGSSGGKKGCGGIIGGGFAIAALGAVLMIKRKKH